MTKEINGSPTSDERMMGALAHFFGMIGALIIWVVQKDKSRFVRFQAAQAMAFGFAVTLLTMILSFCLFSLMFLGIFGTVFAAVNNGAENFNRFMAFPFLFPWLMSACIMPFSLVLFIARIVATIFVLSGNDFHYPLLGAQVEKFLAD